MLRFSLVMRMLRANGGYPPKYLLNIEQIWVGHVSTLDLDPQPGCYLSVSRSVTHRISTDAMSVAAC